MNLSTNLTSSSAPTNSSGEPNRAFTAAAVLLCLLMLLGFSAPTSAVLTIEVTKSVEAAIPIAIVPFGRFGLDDIAAAADLPANIIEADLGRSGKFEALPRDNFLARPNDLRSVRYKNWRLHKVEALVVGRVVNAGAGSYEVRFQLLDVFREKQLAGQKFVVPAKSLRKVAHQISDIIYETLTGKPGAFDTRIAYVTVEEASPGKQFLLQVADADGHQPKTILESSQPILSPAWSPDGGKLAYVSFEKNRSMIYVQDLWSGHRERVAEYAGINGAPAWSPDGGRLAMTLSKEGNPEIYIYDLASDDLRRLTRHTAIDTEPAWSPDGRAIIFTSSRSGTPQIYRIAATGGDARRITFNGKYNAGASYSKDGKSIVLITNQGNGFRVGIYSPQDRTVTELTRTSQDESPTFAANDEMIMYATRSGGRNVLAAVSPDGRVHQIISLQNGIVREPAWSPFNRKQ